MNPFLLKTAWSLYTLLHIEHMGMQFESINGNLGSMWPRSIRVLSLSFLRWGWPSTDPQDAHRPFIRAFIRANSRSVILHSLCLFWRLGWRFPRLKRQYWPHFNVFLDLGCLQPATRKSNPFCIPKWRGWGSVVETLIRLKNLTRETLSTILPRLHAKYASIRPWIV